MTLLLHSIYDCLEDAWPLIVRVLPYKNIIKATVQGNIHETDATLNKEQHADALSDDNFHQ